MFIFICVDALGLSCGTQVLRSLLQHAGSLVVASGAQLPDQGSNSGCLHREHGVLATEPQAGPCFVQLRASHRCRQRINYILLYKTYFRCQSRHLSPFSIVSPEEVSCAFLSRASSSRCVLHPLTPSPVLSFNITVCYALELQSSPSPQRTPLAAVVLKYTPFWNVNLGSHRGDHCGGSLNKLKIELPCDPAIALLCVYIYPEKTKTLNLKR